MRRFVVAPRGQADIDDILESSASRFGPRAAERYRGLIDLAIKELRQDPNRIATKPAEFGELRLYALRFAARRLSPSMSVRGPPHVIVYRFDDGHLEIVRVLHQAMDLPRHLETIPDR